jgi:hypothetical protein
MGLRKSRESGQWSDSNRRRAKVVSCIIAFVALGLILVGAYFGLPPFERGLPNAGVAVLVLVLWLASGFFGVAAWLGRV